MARDPKSRRITFDEKCYLIDGKPQWFLGGCLHYFRVPRGLWSKRILAAKRAGLNTIQTYVPWNYHELSKGKFDFRGERNLNEFLGLCHRLGMYVIVRPGPYICAEWDFGGLPAYLVAEPGIEYRTQNKVFLEAVDRYFKKVLPILVKNQVTQGGPVVLVQNENEYAFWGRPGGRAYLQHLNRSLRRAGITVPIVTCNFLAERIPDTIETWNGFEDVTQGIRALREVQPDTPKTVTEFWAGWFRTWNGTVTQKSAREVHRRVLEVLSARAMYSYYMFHGGTNFEYWGGRSDRTATNFVTTSYDYDAPLSEGGGLTEKYYAGKLANQVGSNFAEFFATSEPSRPRASASQGFEVRALRNDRGEMLFVFRQRDQKARSAQLRFRNRDPLDIDMSISDAGAYLYRYELTPGWTLDYSNLEILGVLKGKVPVVAAFAGTGFKYQVSINGTVLTGKVPRENAPEVREVRSEHEDGGVLRVVIMSRGLALRAWFVESSGGTEMILGPKYVGEVDKSGSGELVPTAGSGEAWRWSVDGDVTALKLEPKPAAPVLPLLRGWRSWSVLDEILGEGRGWKDATKDGEFVAPEALGYDRGYLVYRTTIRGRKRGEARMLFTEAGDRLQIFVNGQYVTTWGRGEGATEGILTLPVEEGPNDVRVLVDNMGRFCFGHQHFGEHKGITGEIYVGARELRLSNLSWQTKDTIRRQHLDTWEMANWVGKWRSDEIMKRLKKGVSNQSGTTLSATFRLDEGCGVLMHLRQVESIALVFVNGELVHRHYGARDASYADLRLDQFAHEGLNDLQVQFLGNAEPERLGAPVRLFTFRKANRLTTKWQLRSLSIPLVPPAEEGAHHLAERMSCYRTTFKCSPPERGVFVELAGLGKGQLFFNGQNLGRYWHIEYPHRYYLPEPYFKTSEELNELVVFEELDGFRPHDVQLMYAAGPRSVEMY